MDDFTGLKRSDHDKRKKYIFLSSTKKWILTILSILFFILFILGIILTIRYATSVSNRVFMTFSFFDCLLMLFTLYFIKPIFKDKTYKKLDNYISNPSGDSLLKTLLQNYIDDDLFGFNRENSKSSRYCYTRIDKNKRPSFFVNINQKKGFLSLRVTETEISYFFYKSKDDINNVKYSDRIIIDKVGYESLSCQGFLNKIEDLYSRCLYHMT
jgi:hypothetical protein